MRLIERIWFGDSAADRAARILVSPLGLIYGGAVRLRSALFDSGLVRGRRATIPVISVGNVTVGGTGKTPVAAWLAQRLASMGKSPAIVLRGYGGDEPLVHSRLNPLVPVVVAADRNAGIAMAADAGANIAILDDAFQHRAAARDVDLVLVSAEDWRPQQRLLPAGPYREPLSSLRRASIIGVTRKWADDSRVRDAEEAVHRAAPGVPVVRLNLELGEIVPTGSEGTRLPVSALAGRSVVAVAAVGNPAAFFRQLEDAGARVVKLPFPDHHSFDESDSAAILDAAEGSEYVVCTLKDAVKLDRFWRAAKSPLWYVSLAVNVEKGGPVIDAMLERLGSQSNNS